MIVWLWDAPGDDRTGRGISGKGEAAREAAEACLLAGHAPAARVEQAIAVPGALGRAYQRTGNGWQGRRSGAAVAWEPLNSPDPGQPDSRTPESGDSPRNTRGM